MKLIRITLVFLLLSFIPFIAFANSYKDEVENIAGEYNIDYDNLDKISLQDIVSFFCEKVKDNFENPFQTTVKLAGIILLCAIINSLNLNNNKDNQKIGNTICTLMIYLNLIHPVKNLISIVGENLLQVKNFMSAFLPVFAGISFASGDAVTSSLYTGLFLSGIIFISDIFVKYLLPSIQFFFALIITNAISDYINLKNLCEFYIKLIKNIMKSAVSIICGALTLQTIISQGTDTFLVKAGKTIAGSTIPIIGTALQDAVGSMYASMEAIKGFAGVVGIAVIISIFAPSLISLGIYWLCTNVLYVFSGMFNEKSISICIKGYIDIIELTISLTVLFGIMLMFSVTIMISLTNGV